MVLNSDRHECVSLRLAKGPSVSNRRVRPAESPAPELSTPERTSAYRRRRKTQPAGISGDSGRGGCRVGVGGGAGRAGVQDPADDDIEILKPLAGAGLGESADADDILRL